MASILLTACADKDFTDITVEMPESLAGNPVIDAYGPLKSYIDRTAHPDFKLGTGVEAGEYNKIGIVYRLVNENYDELTAGNHMKYNFCVNENGDMNFNEVQKFIKNAATAGLSVYGHTLMWHAQQQNKYLNGLIADKKVETGDPNKVVHISMPNPDGWWAGQCFVGIGKSLSNSKTYTCKFRAKASRDFKMGVRWSKGTGWGAQADDNNPVELNLTTDWTDLEFDFVPPMDGMDNFKFTFGDIAGDLYFDDIYVYEKGSEENLMTNSTCDSADNWVNGYGHKFTVEVYNDGGVVILEEDMFSTDFSDGQHLGGWGDGVQFKVVDGVLEISHPNEKQGWEVQVNYENDFEEGQTYFLEIRLKGSVAGNFSAGLQHPDGYKGCGDFSPNFNVTTEWQTVTVSTKCNGPGAKRCLLNIGNYAGTLYFDSYRIYTTKESNVLPMTPEEKHEVLSKALYAWIDGMMEACEGQVVAWDVTNEVMSGSDQDGDGFYEPWNFSNTNAEDQKNNFYWAEHIGALDVVRLPVKYARECFEKHGGDPSKLKLFVNDYNLESFWDDNKKVKSYAHWIQKWEEEEGVVIDGVSSQMHISYEENPEALENRKHHIRQMFEIMAATGKLVRVSEPDMGYNDANGTALKTEQLTEEQHKAMAEYYKWIIKTYFDVVPANQQYGICHWCPTDAPAESGWRGGEPVGLWDLNYNRKWTFTGVADGLANKE